MTPAFIRKESIWVLIPVYGVVLFVVLYVVASWLYPGGSQIDLNAVGFSWLNNYWCNLLNKNAMNGQLNPARPVALTGMFVLCLTLAYFWYLFPRYIRFGKYARLTIQSSGITGMIIALFLFTSLHDTVITVASLFGMIALAGTFTGLYKMKWYRLFWFGVCSLLLVGLNNYVYYTNGLIIYLPVIQKISFAYFLIWVCCITICLSRTDALPLSPEVGA